jgi:DNA-binding NtrC family response regulator
MQMNFTNSTNHRVLLIDDDSVTRKLAATVFGADGWTVYETSSLSGGMDLLGRMKCEAVLCDVMRSEKQVLKLLQYCAQQLPDARVVLTTKSPSASSALNATALGAYDYLVKPLPATELRALSKALREKVNSPSPVFSDVRYPKSISTGLEVIGRSKAFIEVMKEVSRVAATNLPVFIVGESGTGKEVIATLLHQHSSRRDQNLVAVNCGAIPADLIESELFGHVKGSFTGATRDRLGLWEEAAGGTIFLDEITETAPAFQVKLLRALQSGEIRRVGSNETHRFDVRVISASNTDVEREVRGGKLRHDLFYRLNAVSIKLPPLRDRREDILPLARAFARRVSPSHEPTFSPEAIAMLNRYPWPGNIRELQHTVVRAIAVCDGIVGVQDLPVHIRHFDERASEPVALRAEGAEPVIQETWPTMAAAEGRYVTRVLEHTRGNKSEASRILGVDRKTLDRMIKRNNITLDCLQPRVRRAGVRLSRVA